MITLGTGLAEGSYKIKVTTTGTVVERTTVELPFDASLDLVKAAVEALENVESVTVTAPQSGKNRAGAGAFDRDGDEHRRGGCGHVQVVGDGPGRDQRGDPDGGGQEPDARQV